MPKQLNLVSVIIPSFNSAAYLPELCRSIQLQTHKNFQVLIGDDGSTDQTYKAVKPFLKDRRFFYYRKKINKGVSEMTIDLLKKARGTFWCYPGADDVLLPNFMRSRLIELKKRNSAVLVHGPPDFIDERSQPIPNPWLSIKPDKVTPAARAIKQLLQHNFINTPGVFIRMDATKRVLSKVNRHLRYAQDWFLWILLAATGGEFIYDRKCLHKYRIHQNSLTKKISYSFYRKVETRLVPLLAFNCIKNNSLIKASKINKYERSLKSLWIYRYLTIRLRGMQNQIEDLYFKQNDAQKPNLVEIFRAAPHLVRLSFLNRYYKRVQKILVSGLPEINDPIFKK